MSNTIYQLALSKAKPLYEDYYLNNKAYSLLERDLRTDIVDIFLTLDGGYKAKNFAYDLGCNYKTFNSWVVARRKELGLKELKEELEKNPLSPARSKLASEEIAKLLNPTKAEKAKVIKEVRKVTDESLSYGNFLKDAKVILGNIQDNRTDVNKVDTSLIYGLKETLHYASLELGEITSYSTYEVIKMLNSIESCIKSVIVDANPSEYALINESLDNIVIALQCEKAFRWESLAQTTIESGEVVNIQ